MAGRRNSIISYLRSHHYYLQIFPCLYTVTMFAVNIMKTLISFQQCHLKKKHNFDCWKCFYTLIDDIMHNIQEKLQGKDWGVPKLIITCLLPNVRTLSTSCLIFIEFQSFLFVRLHCLQGI